MPRAHHRGGKSRYFKGNPETTNYIEFDGWYYEPSELRPKYSSEIHRAETYKALMEEPPHGAPVDLKTRPECDCVDCWEPIRFQERFDVKRNLAGVVWEADEQHVLWMHQGGGARWHNRGIRSYWRFEVGKHEYRLPLEGNR